MAVVKSDAYGHGMKEVAETLAPYVSSFGVVFMEEALQLRAHGISSPILVFSTTTFSKDCMLKALQQEITLTIHDKESYQYITELAKQSGTTAHVEINVDTGMTRLGFTKEQFGDFLPQLCNTPLLNMHGIYSHLSSADTNKRFTLRQCERFVAFVSLAEQQGCTFSRRHILNTPAVMTGIKTGNVARIGLGLFGLSPSPLMTSMAKKLDASFTKRPALQWKTRVMHLHTVKKNTGIGYGRTYKTHRETTIATLPIGFADGYSRSFSNKGEVLIRGARAPVRGRICMNNMMVEVSHIPDVAVGDEVVVIGQSGEEHSTVETLAKLGTTNPAEIVSTLNRTIPRIYR